MGNECFEFRKDEKNEMHKRYIKAIFVEKEENIWFFSQYDDLFRGT